MQSISRRAFVISAATAGPLGLDGPLEFVDRAFGQQGPGRREVQGRDIR
jgi:hypothetical protein